MKIGPVQCTQKGDICFAQRNSCFQRIASFVLDNESAQKDFLLETFCPLQSYRLYKMLQL